MSAIRIEHLSVRFSAAVLAVDDFSLDIAPGEFVSIVGPSGCGKTTVLNLLTGLLPLNDGKIDILGKTPYAGNPDIAYMLARVGLKGFEHHLPKALSHGMRQRCALARTFCLNSPIMLMDEPFGALDAQTKLQLEDLLLELWQAERRTVVFITHDLGEAVALSDRVIVMSARPGRIIADVKISLKRPRSVKALQTDAAFHEIYSHVWSELERGIAASGSAPNQD